MADAIYGGATIEATQNDMMKKIFTIFLALTMVVGLLAGCGKKNAVEKGESDSNKLSVVTTISPNTTGSEKFSATRPRAPI